MSYIGIERTPTDTTINWSEVGSKITTALNTEADKRTAEKKKIDDESNAIVEFAKTKVPLGNSDYINNIAINLSEHVQSRQLQANRDLKNGLMSQRDYSMLTNNIKSNVSVMFDLTKSYQAEYDEKMKRAQERGASGQEAAFMGKIEGFGNLKDLLPIIGRDGTMYLAKKGPDGKPLTGEDNVMTPQQAQARIKEKIDMYNLDGSVAESVKSLGKTITESIGDKGTAERLGFIRKLNDPTQMKDLSFVEGNRSAENLYLKAEKAIISKELSSSFNVASTLYDYLNVDPKTGKPYEVTTDPKIAASDSHYILWSEKNGIFSPDFESNENGKYQRKQAEEYVRTKVRASLNSEEDISTIQQPAKREPRPEQQWEYEARVGKQNTIRQANLLGYLYSGTPEQIKSATDYFAGLPNISRIVRKKDGVEVYNKAGEKNFVSFTGKDGKAKTQADFIRSLSSSTGVSGDLASLPDQSLGTGKKLNTTVPLTESKKETPPSSLEALTQGISKKLDSSMPPSVGTNDATEKETASALNPILSASGLSMKKSGWKNPLSQIVTIYKGKDALGEINLKDANAVDQIKAIMLKNIPDPTKDPVGFKQASSYFVAPREI